MFNNNLMIMKMVSEFHRLLVVAFGLCGSLAAREIQVWDTCEITFRAENNYANPYIEVETWVLLTGPAGSGSEKKKVWGFWDGENVFKARVMATEPGLWTWESRSNQSDNGLVGRSGSFRVRAWTEAEKIQNLNRRGTVRPTPNDRAFMYADGVRRDHGQTWKEYFQWHESYARYLNYLQSRYGTYNMIFSLMHGDKEGHSISFSDWNGHWMSGEKPR